MMERNLDPMPRTGDLDLDQVFRETHAVVDAVPAQPDDIGSVIRAVFGAADPSDHALAGGSGARSRSDRDLVDEQTLQDAGADVDELVRRSSPTGLHIRRSPALDAIGLTPTAAAARRVSGRIESLREARRLVGLRDAETLVARRDQEYRSRVLDAAEELMVEEGYGAVKMLRLADKAGLMPLLVIRFFRTSNDLYLALLQRKGEQWLQASAVAIASARPLTALWDFNRERAKLTAEFAALADHRRELRDEVTSWAQRLRDMHSEAMPVLLIRYNVNAASAAGYVTLLENALVVSPTDVESQFMAKIASTLAQLETKAAVGTAAHISLSATSITVAGHHVAESPDR